MKMNFLNQNTCFYAIIKLKNEGELRNEGHTIHRFGRSKSSGICR
jgi:hypothetical protein